MDGPNVNWSTYDKLQKRIYEETATKLVNIGSCGLHIIHNALWAGINDTKWDLNHFLYSLYILKYKI